MDIQKVAHELAMLKIKELDLSDTNNHLYICDNYINEFNLFLENLKIATSEEYIKKQEIENKKIEKNFGSI